MIQFQYLETKRFCYKTMLQPTIRRPMRYQWKSLFYFQCFMVQFHQQQYQVSLSQRFFLQLRPIYGMFEYFLLLRLNSFIFKGNGMVILIVLTSRRMQTVTNYFIANLALADVVIGLFSIPFQFQVLNSTERTQFCSGSLNKLFTIIFLKSNGNHSYIKLVVEFSCYNNVYNLYLQAALLQRWNLPDFMCPFCPFFQVYLISSLCKIGI